LLIILQQGVSRLWTELNLMKEIISSSRYVFELKEVVFVSKG